MIASKQTPRSRLGVIAAAPLAVLVILGLVAAHGSANLLLDRGQRLLGQASGMGPAGWLALAGAQTVVAAIGFLPAFLLAIAAGSLYGLVPGFPLAAGATMAGALISFSLSRSAFRPFIHRWLARRARLANIDALYVLGTLASLPALLLYVAMGALARTGLEVWHGGAGRWKLVMGGVTVLAILALSARLGWLVTRQVKTGRASF